MDAFVASRRAGEDDAPAGERLQQDKVVVGLPIGQAEDVRRAEHFRGVRPTQFHPARVVGRREQRRGFSRDQEGHVVAFGQNLPRGRLHEVVTLDGIMSADVGHDVRRPDAKLRPCRLARQGGAQPFAPAGHEEDGFALHQRAQRRVRLHRLRAREDIEVGALKGLALDDARLGLRAACGLQSVPGQHFRVLLARGDFRAMRHQAHRHASAASGEVTVEEQDVGELVTEHGIEVKRVQDACGAVGHAFRLGEGLGLRAAPEGARPSDQGAESRPGRGLRREARGIKKIGRATRADGLQPHAQFGEIPTRTAKIGRLPERIVDQRLGRAAATFLQEGGMFVERSASCRRGAVMRR